MSVHYFFNYREHLVKKLKEHYAGAVSLKREDQILQSKLLEAEGLIRDYFEAIEKELHDVLYAASIDVKLDYDCDDYLVKFSLKENYVKLTRHPNNIEVEIGKFQPDLGMVESYILAHIIPGEKKCHMRRVGMVHESGNFDENSLNYFLKEAFGHIITYDEKDKG